MSPASVAADDSRLVLGVNVRLVHRWRYVDDHVGPLPGCAQRPLVYRRRPLQRDRAAPGSGGGRPFLGWSAGPHAFAADVATAHSRHQPRLLMGRAERGIMRVILVKLMVGASGSGVPPWWRRCR
jgi:hypothetical protein